MAIDWTDIYTKYKGRWVALEDDEQTVVGSGKTLEEALAEASQNGYDEPIVTRMPEELFPFVLCHQNFEHLDAAAWFATIPGV
jgi:Family of unknown function (DUF5678)